MAAAEPAGGQQFNVDMVVAISAASKLLMMSRGSASPTGQGLISKVTPCTRETRTKGFISCSVATLACATLHPKARRTR